jgi:hypothetical protein
MAGAAAPNESAPAAFELVSHTSCGLLHPNEDALPAVPAFRPLSPWRPQALGWLCSSSAFAVTRGKGVLASRPSLFLALGPDPHPLPPLGRGQPHHQPLPQRQRGASASWRGGPARARSKHSWHSRSSSPLPPQRGKGWGWGPPWHEPTTSRPLRAYTTVHREGAKVGWLSWHATGAEEDGLP